jgi:hypothetical protein
MTSVTEDVNEKHLQPWSDLCKRAEITATPLTPYLDQELLYNNAYSIDGSKIESLGFTYTVPKVETAKLKEIIDGYVSIGVFPKNALP